MFVCFRLQKCVLLRLQSFLHLLYFAYFHRENAERTPTQLPANKKCCVLIFAIPIGCIVLADIPAIPFRSLWYIWYCRPIWLSCARGSARENSCNCFVFVYCPEYIRVFFVFPSVPFRSLWYIRYCRSPSSWLSCSAGSPITLVAFLGALCGSTREILLAFTPYTLHLTPQLCCLSPPLTSKLYLRCLSLHPTQENSEIFAIL